MILRGCECELINSSSSVNQSAVREREKTLTFILLRCFCVLEYFFCVVPRLPLLCVHTWIRFYFNLSHVIIVRERWATTRNIFGLKDTHIHLVALIYSNSPAKWILHWTTCKIGCANERNKTKNVLVCFFAVSIFGVHIGVVGSK